MILRQIHSLVKPIYIDAVKWIDDGKLCFVFLAQHRLQVYIPPHSVHQRRVNFKVANIICHHKTSITLRRERLNKLHHVGKFSACCLYSAYAVCQQQPSRCRLLIPDVTPPTLCHQQEVQSLETVLILLIEIISRVENVATNLFGKITVRKDVFVPWQIQVCLIEDADGQFCRYGLSGSIRHLQANFPFSTPGISLLICRCGNAQPLPRIHKGQTLCYRVASAVRQSNLYNSLEREELYGEPDSLLPRYRSAGASAKDSLLFSQNRESACSTIRRRNQ